jgi:hypothetical protein
MFITHTCELSQFSKFVMSQRQLHLESKIWGSKVLSYLGFTI